MLARLFAYLQFVLPRYWLTSVIHKLARVKNERTKNFLISHFVRLYDVDIDCVKLEVPEDFASFNDFFIRELEEGARPVDPSSTVVVSPVDGTVSQAGYLRADRILQAKGIDYSLDDLLATDLEEARAYSDGLFATLYLAPYNYHRVHAPFDGEIVAARYIPGDLFSVNKATAAHVRGLFSRNERLVLHFETAFGPAALIFVGALNVGSISTPWSGEIRPRKKGIVEVIDLGDGPTAIKKGDLLGWFNMGSTVILLMPDNACKWRDTLKEGAAVEIGVAIGDRADAVA